MVVSDPGRQARSRLVRHYPSRRAPSRSVDRTADYSSGAAFVSILFVAGVTVGTFLDAIGDGILGVAAVMSIPFLLMRISRVARFLPWILIFCSVYAIGSVFSEGTSQGLRHTVSTVTAACALMLYASFGREVLMKRWFHILASLFIVFGLFGTATGSLAKNISGGVMLYFLALLALLAFARGKRRSGTIVLAYLAMAVTLALVLDFRSLIAYAAVFALAYIGALRLQRRAYWFMGIAGSALIIVSTIWYFLNITTSQIAIDLTRLVSEASGRPATSGREWLWPAIVDAVERTSPWIGLGPGALPRDFLPTTFSAHSYYLQVYMQWGWIGVVVLVCLLVSVWSSLTLSRNSIGNFGSAVFLMFVAHNSTEVLMFQNGLMAAIPAWCVVGAAIAFREPEAGAPSAMVDSASHKARE